MLERCSFGQSVDVSVLISSSLLPHDDRVLLTGSMRIPPLLLIPGWMRANKDVCRCTSIVTVCTRLETLAKNAHKKDIYKLTYKCMKQETSVKRHL